MLSKTKKHLSIFLALVMVMHSSASLTSCSKKDVSSTGEISSLSDPVTGSNSDPEGTTDSSDTASSSQGHDTSDATSQGSSTDATETTSAPRDPDHYYSQIDDGIATEIVDQGKDGNCWAISALASMRTNFLITYSEDLDLTIDDVTFATVSAEKEEGLRMRKSGTEKETGGLPIYVCWAMANGCDGYTVTEYTLLYESAQEPDLHNTYVTNLATKEQVKALIRNKGAVIVLLHDGKGEVEGDDYFAIYDSASSRRKDAEDGELSQNYFTHAAVIVGWDDDFPKENFSKSGSSKKGSSIPEEDGAWLLQNSGGTDWGDGGFAWVSYESAILFDGVMTVTDKYTDVLSYDVGALCGIRTGEETVVANVYHHEGTLTAVGTYVGIDAEEPTKQGFSSMTDTSITIEIRDASMQEIFATKDFEPEFFGYYVVELDDPVEVSDFAVVVRYGSAAPVEAEMPGGSGSRHNTSNREYITTIEEGQSFVYLDGEWLDLADPETQEALGIDYAPHNCCIKALFEDG
ncbi:MAG: hypothetical protein IK020_05110 [Clostridiales bacterium]|nr:hypothetical protein [Clostridiales bacterium]